MTLPVTEKGEIAAPPAQVFQAIAGRADILLLGDTHHRNPKIKQAAFDMLPALRKQGFTSLWLEMDRKHQPKLDAIMASNPSTKEELLPAISAKYNKEVLAEGILSAHQHGMEIDYIDDRRELEVFRKESPRFVELDEQIRSAREGGMDRRSARESVLSPLPLPERQAYEQAEVQWKQLRDSINPSFANIMQTRTASHPRQIALVGDGHFNRLDDMDELLNARGHRTATMHIYEHLAGFGEYLARNINRTPDDGHPRRLPDYVYCIERQAFMDPAHPATQQQALAEYQHQQRPKTFVETIIEQLQALQEKEIRLGG